MITQPDIDFIRALKSVGMGRARELFSYMEAWEEVSAEEEKPRMSKSKLQLVTNVGEVFSSKVPHKRVGRVADPNSRFQRICKETAHIISKEGAYHTDKHNSAVALNLGLTIEQVRMYNQDVRKKLKLTTVAYGIWKKAA